MKTSVKSVFAALAAATLALTSCVSDNGEPKKGNNDVNNEYATLFINILASLLQIRIGVTALQELP